eukprot:Rmarinus@m.26684
MEEPQQEFRLPLLMPSLASTGEYIPNYSSYHDILGVDDFKPPSYLTDEVLEARGKLEEFEKLQFYHIACILHLQKDPYVARLTAICDTNWKDAAANNRLPLRRWTGRQVLSTMKQFEQSVMAIKNSLSGEAYDSSRDTHLKPDVCRLLSAYFRLLIHYCPDAKIPDFARVTAKDAAVLVPGQLFNSVVPHLPNAFIMALLDVEYPGIDGALYPDGVESLSLNTSLNVPSA